VDLSGVDLSGADLFQADLSGADLSQADLLAADLSEANLSGANLIAADLRQADLRGADLRQADLRWAYLGEAILSGANLSGANLSQARVGLTIFVDVDLRLVLGLESVEHWAPSSIGIDTSIRSDGRIPESFLRGAGVPDAVIASIANLRTSDFYSCFISYSTADQAFADRLHADLQARGVRCWFAPHDIQGGRKIDEQIDEAIKVYDKLLLILSDASMTSNWVKTEIANARAKEKKQKRQMLFPISVVPHRRVKAWKLFDADTGIDSAREIREYFIPDFSKWKDDDSYQTAFKKLLRDLNQACKSPTSP
jgi:uncharacterized protein YjbI with pentapeptide repeats